MAVSRSPDFVVRLVGSDVKPWTVPMRTLARVMDAIQRLVEQKEEECELEDRETPHEMQAGEAVIAATQTLKLVGIRTQSAGYAIASELRKPAIDVLAAMGNAIENPTSSEWSGATISSLKDLSDVAKSLSVKIEIRKPEKGRKLGDVIAKITPTTYHDIYDNAFLRGETSLFGRIERVGGAVEARCSFRLPDQSKLIYCDISNDDLAQQLARHLYENVTVHGEATWLRLNWQIRSFRIRSFDMPKSGSLQDALHEIWEAGGRAWDEIEDPDAYVAGMRG